MKKCFAVLLVVCMMVTMFAGCGKKEDNSNKDQSSSKSTSTTKKKDTNEDAKEDIFKDKANLVMYVIGSKPRDYEAMMTELNTLIERDLNATLTINHLPWGDWRTKYPLILASGEKVDLIYTSNWAFYQEQTRKGAFKDIDGMLEEYAPNLLKSIPTEGWEQARVDGKIYMVPCNKLEYESYGFIYRKDLANKYGMSDIKNLDDLEAFMTAVKENEQGMLPYNAGTWDIRLVELMYSGLKPNTLIPLFNEDWNAFVNINDFYKDDMNVIIDEYEEDYLDYLKRMRKWQEKGFWSKSVLSNKVGSKDAFETGTSAIALSNSQNYNEMYKKLSVQNPDWEFGYFDFYADKSEIIVLPLISNGMAVTRTSKYPERALMLLEKLQTDEDYYYLTHYGIEGKNYVVDENGNYALPEGVSMEDNGFPGGAGSPWGWDVTAMDLPSGNDFPAYLDNVAKYEKIATFNPMEGFSPITDSIEAEMAAVSNVLAQYKTPLVWGMVEDVEEGYKTMVKKAKEAGYDTIIDEVTKQFKEYANELN